MSHRTLQDVIDPHRYGLEAAAAKDPYINSFLFGTEPADIVKSIDTANQISDEDERYLAMGAILDLSATGDREAAVKSIKDQEYLDAHYRLAKLVRMYRLRHDKVNENPTPPIPIIDEMPEYPTPDQNYQPAATSITENLYETIQASNAPSAAISAATRSI